MNARLTVLLLALVASSPLLAGCGAAAGTAELLVAADGGLQIVNRSPYPVTSVNLSTGGPYFPVFQGVLDPGEAVLLEVAARDYGFEIEVYDPRFGYVYDHGTVAIFGNEITVVDVF